MSYDMLASINSRINKFPYVADPVAFDDWSPANEAGSDCDSYAVAKYRALIEAGFNAGPLRLATCHVETGEYHAVLLADVAGETWVLDNRHPFPMRYADLPYKWDKLQIAGTAKWEAA